MNDITEEGQALRWRKAVLRLTESFHEASHNREDLAPALLAALHNALEQLLVYGNEADLLALEEWLNEHQLRG